jgi:hypothetical protein
MAMTFAYENVVLPRSHTFESEKGQPPRAVEVHTFMKYGETMEENPELELLVDRDGGISFWQAEGLEPSDFIGLMAIVHQGVCEARGLMGQAWEEPEIQTSRQFDFITVPASIGFEGNPIRVRILVYPVQDVVGTDGAVTQEFADEPVLDGSVDWQNGILLGRTEGIEPEDFVAIMAAFHAGLWEARDQIGASWIHGENGREYDPADAPTS